MLVINPQECIDCGVCEPECPADAIRPDTAPGASDWIDINQKYSTQWPNITTRKPPMPAAKEYDPTEGYMGGNKWHLFSSNPGTDS